MKQPRQNAYQDLPEKEEWFEKLANTTTTSIFIYQKENFVYVNKACLSLTGYTTHELLHEKKFWEIVAPADRALVKERGLARQRGEKIINRYEFRVLCKDGTIKWLDFTAGVIDWNGQPAGMGTAYDITARKETEEKLRENETRFRIILENLPVLLDAFDKDGNIIFWNKACEEATGYKAEEILGNPKALEMLYPDPGYRQFVWDSANDPNMPKNETILTRKDGKPRIINWYDTHHYIHIPGWEYWGVGEDITDHKLIEQAQQVMYRIANAATKTTHTKELIETIRQELTALIDTTNFYIALYDNQTGMLSSPYEIDQKDHIESWPAERSLTGQVITEKRPVLLKKPEIVQLIKNGTIDQVGTICEVWLGVPLYYAADIAGAIVVQSYDNPNVYDEKSLEMLAFVSNQVSRTMQLNKYIEDLRREKKRAQESDRLKTAFLNNISHEIRTPLNGILGFGQMLCQDSKDSRQQMHLKNMQISSQRLIDTINKMIDISMVMSDTLKIEKTDVHIPYLMEGLRESFDARCKEKRIDCQVIIDDTVSSAGPVSADAELLRKAMAHLIDNAIKFTDHGKIDLGVKKEGSALIFFVRDTGRGIDKKFIDELYEPFSQEVLENTRGHEGSGLGLPIAKGIINKMGGTVWVESEKGSGCTFYLSIPFIAHSASGPAPDNITREQLASGDILVADDDEMARFLTEIMLEDFNNKLIMASNGKEAVQAFRDNPGIALVLMDIKMPVMDGIEATRQIKKIRKEVPVIAITAHALAGDESRIRTSGCDDYISKPIDTKQFLEKVKQYLPVNKE